MRIYKSDGTFTDSPHDVEFGWVIDEITADGRVAVSAPPSHDRISLLAHKSSTTSSTASSDTETPPIDATRILRCESRIKVEPIASCFDPKLPSEGLAAGDPRIDLNDPTKQQLANLITPCSLETKMLLAIVHFAKYMRLDAGEGCGGGNLPDLANRKLDFILDGNKDSENDLRTQIENYHATKEDSMLSLMVELILADVGCTIADITGTQSTNDDRTNFESSDLDNSIKSESTSGDNKPSSFSHQSNSQNRSELLQSSGFGEAIDKSIESITAKTSQLQLQIAEIKKDFHEQEKRADALIAEVRIFRRNLEEIKYLDDLLRLLNGNIEKIRPKKWPFRMFSHPHDKDEPNLII